MLNTTFSNADTQDVTESNDFRRVGILKNPYAFGTTSGNTLAFGSLMPGDRFDYGNRGERDIHREPATGKSKDTNIMHLEMAIVNKVGLNVEIQNKKNNKGKIVFEYKNLDQLNKIIDIIKSNY